MFFAASRLHGDSLSLATCFLDKMSKGKNGTTETKQQLAARVVYDVYLEDCNSALLYDGMVQQQQCKNLEEAP